MRDVAQAAGVSTMAVSAVLSGGGTNVIIAKETAERIREAARTLRGALRTHIAFEVAAAGRAGR